MFRTLLKWLGLELAVILFLPAVAWASTATSAPTLVLPWQQLWPIVIGALVPLVTYVLNHFAPWVSEQIKGIVLVIVSAVATALYTALATNVIGFNASTLQLILTGIGAALAAHQLLWKPAGISTLLGGGSNRVVKKVGVLFPPAGAHNVPLGTPQIAPQAVASLQPPPPPPPAGVAGGAGAAPPPPPAASGPVAG